MKIGTTPLIPELHLPSVVWTIRRINEVLINTADEHGLYESGGITFKDLQHFLVTLENTYLKRQLEGKSS